MKSRHIRRFLKAPRFRVRKGAISILRILGLNPIFEEFDGLVFSQIYNRSWSYTTMFLIQTCLIGLELSNI